MSNMLNSQGKTGGNSLIENRTVCVLVACLAPAPARRGPTAAPVPAPLRGRADRARPTPRGGIRREEGLPLAVRPAFLFKANEVRK